MSRIRSLDAWRGLIIVVMALDHANGFVAERKLDPEMWAGPFPNYAGDWAAFLTRFVTHLAAPGFFFLLGVGAVLFAEARQADGWSTGRIIGQLAVRGGVLIALQFLVENPAWRLGEEPAPWTYVGVLFALGGALVVLSPLVRAPVPVLLGGAMVAVIATEAVLPEGGWAIFDTWQVMALFPGAAEGWFSLYPIMPWLAPALVGMAFARAGVERLIPRSGWIGVGCVLLAVVVRVIGGFGNIRDAGEGLMGFLNTVKYPPALVFWLPAVGVGLVALSALSRSSHGWRAWLADRLAVFGSAPLFFYLTHLYLYAQIGIWLAPTSLPIMYLWWLVGLVLLYPACRWFGGFKRSRSVSSPVRML